MWQNLGSPEQLYQIGSPVLKMGTLFELWHLHVNTHVPKVECDSKLCEEIASELGIHVEDFLQISQHNLVQVTVGQRPHTVV